VEFSTNPGFAPLFTLSGHNGFHDSQEQGLPENIFGGLNFSGGSGAGRGFSLPFI
jgi:hypothetical protein